MSPAPPTLALSPGPITPDGRTDWTSSGRTLAHALSPGTAELALVTTVNTKDLNPTVPPPSKGSSSSTPTFPGDRGVFLARWDAVPLHLVPLYSRTYTIFQSLQQIAAQTASGEAGGANGFANGSQGLPTASQISFYSRVCSLYIDTIRQHLLPPAAAEPTETTGDAAPPSSSFPEADLVQWSHTLSTLHLARILYMPSDGRGDGVVGEELLDWVNLTDCGPTEEEGEEILGAGGEHAWRHPEFWSYLLRSLLRGFLSSAGQLLLTLASHPAGQLAQLAPRLASHLGAYPRSSSEEFATERAFVQAHAQWRASLRLLTRPLTPGWARSSWSTSTAEEDDEDDVDAQAQAVEESVGSVVELLAGSETRVLDESVDWREALGAWGVWVRPGLKRDDLPSTVDQILAALPPLSSSAAENDEDDDGEASSTAIAAETVQTALLKGDCTGAVTAANDHSLWLATHLTDLLSHLALVPLAPSSADRRRGTGRSLRDHYVLEYASHLAADRALWHLACEYAGRVRGPEGKMTVGALLGAVSLDKEEEQEGGEPQREGDEPAVDQEKVEEILKLMHAHGLEEQARTLARVVAERLVRERQFGLAVAFSVRAGDARKLDGIADRILDTYVRHGPQQFIAHVESIPTSLLDPFAAPASSVFSPNLAFLPLYRQFLAAYDQGQRDVAAEVLVRAFWAGLAPRAFWAVLMVDLVPLLDDADMLVPTDAAYLLLQHLEDLLTSSTDAPVEHLAHLANLRASTGGKAPAAPAQRTDADWRDVRKSLDVVRLALARYLARDLAMS